MSELVTRFAEGLRQDSGAGPAWAKTLRANATEQFGTHGFPSRKDEAWKYTALGVLEQNSLRLVSAAENASTDTPKTEPLVDADVLVKMLDGYLVDQSGQVPDGLTIQSLSDALDSDIAGLQDLLESLPNSQPKPGSTNGFSALNTATLDAGLLVRVAKNSDGGRVLLQWSSAAAEHPRLFNSRVCIILEQGAKLELVEQFESTNSDAGNIVVQCDLATKSSMQHIRFQQQSEEAVLVTRTEVAQQSDSHYNYYGFDLGGRLVRHDLHASLHGSGAKSGLNGAYLVDGRRHVDNHAKVDHMSVGGYSEQYFRGIVGGNGRAVFNTAVVVHPGADETEARQSNANILLSARAEVDTKPELEIYADEVIASHGATVGQLDEQAVFYMRSRGLTEQQARQLLTTAFCRSVSDKLPDAALGELIAQRMMDVMPQAEQ
jgi:Fe-S cluster assembly protein SufD